MRGLQGMYFTGNRLTRIAPEVFSMTWLRKLQVSQNHITDLPDGIGNLSNLIHLNLSSKRIPVAGRQKAAKPSLRVRFFVDNRLPAYRRASHRCESLIKARIRKNPIAVLPAGFAEMPGTIDITGTRIELNQLSPALRARISTEKAPAGQGCLHRSPATSRA